MHIKNMYFTHVQEDQNYFMLVLIIIYSMNEPANCFLLCGIVILNLNEIIILQLKLVLKLQQMYIDLF